MPFVRIDIKTEVPAARARAIADAAHAALVEAIAIPVEDRFQVVTNGQTGLIYDPSFLGIARGEGIVMIEVHLSFGRSVALKKALYATMRDRLVALGLRQEDVFIHLVETDRVNWSFGNGIMQYENPPPHLAPAPGAA